MRSTSQLSIATRYSQIIEHIFFSHYKKGAEVVLFHRTGLAAVAAKLYKPLLDAGVQSNRE